MKPKQKWSRMTESGRMKKRLRDEDVLKTIGDYYALGMSPEIIRDKIKEEHNIKTGTVTIRNLIKSISIRRKELIHSDDAMAKIYKYALNKVKDEIYKNIAILNEIRDDIIAKYQKVKKDAPSNKLFQYTREITSMIRTQNDTVRSLNEYLKRLEIETTEVKVNAAKSVQETISKLKELEAQGFVKILQPFYNNNQFGQEMSQEEEHE